MKANQAFRNADEAVSPVIGVILMVAITVVLAAVVFVLVSNLSKTSDKGEDAQATISSPASNKIYLTLIRGGQNSPYQVATGTTGTPASAAQDVTITVDSNPCVVTTASTPATNDATGGEAILQDSNGNQKWDVGETIIINNINCASTPATLGSGTSHLVSLIVHGTILQDNSNVVIK